MPTYWDEIDALAAAAKPPKQGKLTLRKGEPAKLPKMQIQPAELAMVEKIQGAVTFPPGGSHKSFIGRLTADSMLTDRGRNYLAYIAHRYRKQWKASADEARWIEKWKNF